MRERRQSAGSSSDRLPEASAIITVTTSLSGASIA
jgi:hypothetical protein